MNPLQPIATAPICEYVLVTGGGLPGVANFKTGILRPDANAKSGYSWQWIGDGAPFGGANYWMPFPVMPTDSKGVR